MVTGLLQPPAEPSKVGPCLCSPSSLPALAKLSLLTARPTWTTLPLMTLTRT